MPMTDISLSNAALAKLGARQIISFVDGSTEADLCRQLYAITVDATLIAHPWSFSLAQAPLMLASTPPEADFSNAFALPDDLLRTISAGAPGSGRGLFYRIFGRELHADLAEVTLTYQRRVSEDRFPAYFTAALITRLAAELCLPLTENASRAEILARLAASELQHARLVDSQQSTPRVVDDYTLIQARYS